MKIGRLHSYLTLASIVVFSSTALVICQVFWKARIMNVPLHSTFETIQAMAAVFMATFLLQGREKTPYDGKLFLMAIGFLGMGVLNGFHAMTIREGFTLLHVVASLVGGFCFSLIWVPGLLSDKHPNRRGLFLWIVAGMAAFFSMWTIFYRETLPTMVRDGKFASTAISLSLTAGVLFAVSAVRFIVDFSRTGSVSFFLFACMAMLFGIAELNFPFSAPWDITWWLNHALRLAASLVVMGFLLYERSQTEEELTKYREHLEESVEDRTRELSATNKHLEAANKELESFSYSVSHDLRAPLRHIGGYVELLQKKASSALDEKSLRYLTTISEAAKRMGLLIDDLLTFSRIGRAEMQKTVFNLNPVVEELLEDLRPQIKGREIAWEIGPLPDVYGDRSLIKLVFQNLIDNAIKFTSPRAQARIEIGATSGGEDESVLFVRDNGVGFDMKYVDKLFGVFQRLQAAGQFEGTGIGLANVHRIIHRHGGKTWAEGVADGGATFYISIPKPING